MNLTGEICGAGVEAWSDGVDVTVQVGDETYSPDQIEALAVSHADWTGTISLGGFVFASTGLAALKRFAAAAGLAAQAECGSNPE